MRTTLTVEDDLFQLLEREAAENNLSFKEVVNSTLRRGLAAKQLAQSAPKPRVVVKPFTGGLLPGIDPNRMNQLNDELEVEGFLDKAARDTSHP